MNKVLITGANGFVGQYLCTFFRQKDVPFRKAVRTLNTDMEDGTVVIGNIDSQTDWTEALDETDVVVHLAARVHVMREKAGSPLDEFRRVNTAGTLNLARQAIDKGVRRFIFLSTIKVHGEETTTQPFHPDDEPAPVDPYSVSKLEAELGLQQISSESCMDYVIIRPPLIYGRGVRGNFARLANLVRKGWFLPFGMIRNRRSMVGIENLCSLILTCLNHTNAANRVLLVSDGEDVSTPDLIQLLGDACQCPTRLIGVPLWLLYFFGRMIGKGQEMKRLTGNLQVSIAETCRLVDWQPVHSLKEGVRDSI